MQSRIYENNIDERFYIALICIHVANSSMAEDNVMCKRERICKENAFPGIREISQFAECHNQTRAQNSSFLILVA